MLGNNTSQQYPVALPELLETFALLSAHHTHVLTSELEWRGLEADISSGTLLYIAYAR